MSQIRSCATKACGASLTCICTGIQMRVAACGNFSQTVFSLMRQLTMLDLRHVFTGRLITQGCGGFTGCPDPLKYALMMLETNDMASF